MSGLKLGILRTRACPKCGEPLARTNRSPLERVVSAVVPLARYECRGCSHIVTAVSSHWRETHPLFGRDLRRTLFYWLLLLLGIMLVVLIL